MSVLLDKSLILCYRYKSGHYSSRSLWNWNRWLSRSKILTIFLTVNPRSLDAPLERGPAGSDAGEAGVLLDRLADPRSLVGDLPEPDGVDPLAAERVWFRQQMAALDPMRRQLVEGRLRLGCTWVELGRQLGIHPRMAQRRCDATMHELRQAAERWQASRDGAGIA